MRILIVDDDEILVDVLKRSLSSQRHIVDTAEDGQLGWEYVQMGEYDLVLLDVNLPGLDGVSLCATMRAEGYATPILLMTAKNASQDRILGLDAGADDYLTKPLDLGELNARIRALSRRGEVATTSVLEVDGLTLDPNSCEVSYQQQPIKLTAKEYSLLEIFLRNPARVFSRAQILDKIWTFDDPPLEESVKAHIKGLRKKLKQAGAVDWIENVYGIGYRLNPKIAQPSLESNHSSLMEQEFNQRMEQMWLKHQDKMGDRLNVLHHAVSLLKKAQLSPETKHSAERAAHKLAGVLGMFSRDAGTDIAGEIEILLQDNSGLNIQQQRQFIDLVADLDRLLALDSVPTTSTATETQAELLLISADANLYQDLQQFGKTQGLSWHQIDRLLQAETWLDSRSPYMVAIDTETATQPQEYLSLVSKLNSRNPAIPTLVLSPTDCLSERLSAIRAGANSFLVKPVTSEIIWQTGIKLIKQHQSATTSILIVDDDVVFLDAMRSLLEPWGIRVRTLARPSQFWQELQLTPPDLVILDIEMPEINGIELCQTLRSDPDWQELPVLFLTARRDVSTIQQVFEVGGDDYISKPVISAELIARINNRLERSRLLRSLATQDRLTGLTNRFQSSRELESLLPAKNNHRGFCLAVVKITELEQINFKYGHQTGDRILAQWGKVIQAVFRKDEITSYWGNGDFIIGLPNLDKIQGKEHLTELLTILRKQVFSSAEGERFQIAFRCGIAEDLKDGNTLHALYQTCIQRLSY
ncbi:response regulator [Pleurocapsales cyanobacterium LEGE 10410]|nr:response regulator [Pleurocapsales cyanobacterium LEGE 10410]